MSRCWCRSEVLRLGPQLDVLIQTLAFVNCNIKSLGCEILGKSLSSGMNTSLRKLNLDYNEFGNEAFVKLVHGLRSNGTLEILSARFCKMEGIDFAASLCDLINNGKSQIHTINIEGNKIGAKGLGIFSRGLRKNKTLVTLDISDNAINIDYEPKAFALYSNALKTFGEALLANRTLREINFRFNTLGKPGAEILLPVLDQNNYEEANTTLNKFFVSTILEKGDFEALNRNGKAKKKGGKKKKKKKK